MRFNNKMMFCNVGCQKISIHPALCITLGSFLTCYVEQLGLYFSEHTNICSSQIVTLHRSQYLQILSVNSISISLYISICLFQIV